MNLQSYEKVADLQRFVYTAPAVYSILFPNTTTLTFKKPSNIVHFSLCKASDSSKQNGKYTLLDYFLHFQVLIYNFEPKVYFIGLMTLPEVMKSRRKTLSLSQQDLAEMAGIGLSTIKDIERGKGNPSMATVSKILEILGMEIVFKVRQTV